jgi:hypothetical protein
MSNPRAQVITIKRGLAAKITLITWNIFYFLDYGVTRRFYEISQN